MPQPCRFSIRFRIISIFSDSSLVKTKVERMSFGLLFISFSSMTSLTSGIWIISFRGFFVCSIFLVF
ncbi:hypothetical protein MCHI_000209 [Candidatus Magnetoovum chiemensis]|nr:hypothetical protein MCHI_000209 [Candidatus Magnetoovum chiemensis]